MLVSCLLEGPMLLVIDAGNTNIKLGLYEKEKLCSTFRLATERQKTDDQFAVILFSFFQAYNINYSDIDGCIISSVVPPITAPLQLGVKKLLGIDSIVLGAGIKTGLNIKIDDTSAIGSDIVASCVAAAAFYDCPCIVIGMGTATTISVLDETKTMIGGSLIPGVSISLNALISTSALLPSVSLDAPKKVIGTNTDECMRSGIVLGSACMLDGMIEKIETALNQSCTLIATGGIAPTIVTKCKHDIILRDDLILEGLRLIYVKNQRKHSKAPNV